jgi:hypothetical protein
MLIGFWVAGQVTDHFSTAGKHDWWSIWLFPATFALAVFVLFWLSFQTREERAVKPAI